MDQNKRKFIIAASATPIILTLRSGLVAAGSFMSCVNVGTQGGTLENATDQCGVSILGDSCEGQTLQKGYVTFVDPVELNSVMACPENAFVVSSAAFTSLM